MIDRLPWFRDFIRSHCRIPMSWSADARQYIFAGWRSVAPALWLSFCFFFSSFFFFFFFFFFLFLDMTALHSSRCATFLDQRAAYEHRGACSLILVVKGERAIAVRVP
jgi:hypothetical protein